VLPTAKLRALLLLLLLLQVWQLTKATLPQCRATCSKFFYPLAIISSDFKCRCSWSTPEERQRLPESQCQPGLPGMAVFYMNQRVSKHMHVRYIWKLLPAWQPWHGCV
jgi:hypothetical protein